ncbi:hypothetical protein [Bacillus sp. V33-4]|uniref:hypothetical protein n=1 Tax=Bacillus sp. V33-4 TaxID=2054169 RepID=UPI00115B12E0|nr:hypothetical protein [Bacillus sp. V33-4]
MEFNIEQLAEQLPDFSDHEGAHHWFTQKYGERFVLRETNTIEGKKVYFYHVIKEPGLYNEYLENISDEISDEINPDAFRSYSTIEISEDGDVSISI